MPRFFIENINSYEYTILGDDAKHITKSLRMKVGENLVLCDSNGFDYYCAIKSMSTNEVIVRIMEKLPNKTEPSVEVTLYQALPKGDKMEFIVQKAVELGVSKIVPVLTERCISRPNHSNVAKKILRFQSVSLEAAKQSGRGKVPKVEQLVSFKEAISDMAKLEKSCLFYENAEVNMSEQFSEIPKEFGIMVGSEGGFSAKEVEFAQKENIKITSLGGRILRCETAPIVALSAIMYAAGEF